MWRAAGTNRRDSSTDGRRAHRHVPATSPAPPRASRARAIFRAAAAARSPPTCSANGRTGLRSSLVVIRNQAIEQAHAVTRSPALVDLRLARAHRGPRDVEMRPWRVVDEALQELRGRDRAAMPAAG